MTAKPLHPWDEEPFKSLDKVAKDRDWPTYYAAVTGKPPRDTLLKALELFEREGVGPDDEPGQSGPSLARPTAPLAIDLGCGEGRDAAELLRRGWRVLAIDGHPEALRLLDLRDDLAHRERLRTRLALLEHAELEPCLLVNASFSLPFCDPRAFGDLWRRMVEAIQPGGRFAGQLFGDRDAWASIPGRSHFTRERVVELLAPFDLEHFQEDEKDGFDATGDPKHWHVFHIVGRRT